MSYDQRTVAVIPARYASTRFPGKPLAIIAGKPMVQWVYEKALGAKSVGEVIVATDDQRIADAVADFGGRAVMTSPDHPTGTDRIAEAIEKVDADLIINIQGDEPLVPSEVVDRLVAAMRSSQAEMGTVAVPFEYSANGPENPNAVKVVTDRNGFALYFSRSLIPFPREGGVPAEPLLHWGLYAYRRDFLYDFVSWSPGRLEQCEMLEQLRALENGARIMVIQAAVQSIGVDTPEDVAKVESKLV